MTGTITTDLVFFAGSGNNSNCDSTTNWSSGTLDTDNMIEGTGCLTYTQNSAASRDILYTCTSIDISAGAIYFWIRATKPSICSAFYIYLGDGTNYSKWNVTIGTGWTCFCIKTDQTRDSGSGTVNFNAITRIGFGYTTTGKCIFYWDAFRWGTYLQITGGSEGVPTAFSDLFSTDDTNKYGIIQKIQGVYFVQGKIYIGGTSQTETTYFKDTGQVLIFIDNKVGDSFYTITGQGAASYATKIYFGSKSGTKGISGLVIKSASTTKRYTITMTNSYVTYFGFYGTSFIYANTITFPTYNANKEVITCNFETCAQVIASTTAISYSKFLNSIGIAVQINSTSFHITYTDFIACATAIELTVAGPYSYNSLSFSSCTYDGKNTYGSTIAVSYDSGCSPAPSTYDPAGSEITYATSVTLTVRHVKSGNEPTTYAVVAIYKASDMTQIMDTDASTVDDQNAGYYKASTSYATTGIAVKVRARYKGYLPFEVTLIIPANGLDVTAIWIVDPNYTP